jgi:hypothetical protein
MSVSVHPPISAGLFPKFRISTNSSASEVGTSPSKKMQTISTFAGAGVGSGAGVAVVFGVVVGTGEGAEWWLGWRLR